MVIHIINGPNLNLLGRREPEVYGNRSLDQYLQELMEQFPQHTIDVYQSNIEGEIVDRLQQVGFDDCAIVLNAGGYTHTSVAIADAVAAITAPVIEVHISNIYSREPFRHKSLLSPVCKGIIAGFSLDSYRLALHSLTTQFPQTTKTTK
ncbi:MAG: 3-dehydroquinate dehydratase [Muribaculaceae bacterium]|nr:3-dehydroquinate dehydratase [Muribaculaceae bacterium]